MTLLSRDDPEGIQLSGEFVSADEITFGGPHETIGMKRVRDPSMLQGTWSGNLDESNGRARLMTFEISATGRILEMEGEGLIPRATGWLFVDADSNDLVGMLRTGAIPDDPFNQIRIVGSLTPDQIIMGSFTIDGDPGPTGTVRFHRQGEAP